MSRTKEIQGNLLFQKVLEGIKLTDQQLYFVLCYCTNGFKAVDAMDAAGYPSGNPKNKSSRAYQLRNSPQVAKAIERFMNHSFKNSRIEVRDRIKKELHQNAFYDIGEILDIKGQPIHDNLLDYTKEQRNVIREIIPKRYGKDGDVEVWEYKLANKETSIKYLMQLFQLTGNANGGANIDLDVNVNSGEGNAPVINVNIAAPTELQKEHEVDGTTTFLEDEENE